MNNENESHSVVTENHLGGYEFGGDPNTWYPHLWNWMIKELGVSSLIDVGCGEGYSTRYFKSLGCDVLGVEGSSEAIKDSVIPENVVQHDYCSGPFQPNKLSDSVWCCEFVEHVEEQYVDNFLTTFTSSKKYVFMTHALPGQTGWHHVNCQPDHYWIEKVENLGFKFSHSLTKKAKVLAGKGYFSLSGLVFVKDGITSELPLSIIIYLKYYLILLKNILNKIGKIISKVRNLIGIFLRDKFPRVYAFLRKIRDYVFIRDNSNV